MDVALFDYHLPRRLIAQEPAARRDQSRLLVVDRSTRSLAHRSIRDLGDYLRSGDCLVVNDTRVIPARLLGRLPTGGKVELLLLRRRGGTWEALGRPGRKLRAGAQVQFGDGRLRATVTRELPDGLREVRLDCRGPLAQALAQLGHTPLPPYIRRPDRPADRERYQTVYAAQDGAVAAPTAGLHFTPELLGRLERQGVGLVRLTLHVGLGTFKPVEVESVEDHVMHSEAFEVSAQAATAINAARKRGGRIVAVGTTVVRALETVADQRGTVHAGAGDTDIFIYPGYRFKAVDLLLTNFHLPRSTLLMLVCAFADRELILQAYAEAVREQYRFYSYGDAMLIL